MKKKGLTLIEVIVSTAILALIMAGLANVFVASKRHTLHSRSRLQTTELGKLFLAPLQQAVKQSDWSAASGDYNANSPLRLGTRTGSAVPLNGIDYTPTYEISRPPGFSGTSPMRKLKVTIRWNEPSP